MGKGENAGNQYFPLSCNVYLCTSHIYIVILKSFSFKECVLTLYAMDSHLKALTTDSFCYKQFLLLFQRLLLNQIIVSSFSHIFDIIFLFDTTLEKQKIGISDKGLNFLLFGRVNRKYW